METTSCGSRSRRQWGRDVHHRTRTLAGTALVASLLAVAGSGCLVDGLGGGDEPFGSSCDPHFESDGPCESACDASSVVLVQGNRYCTGQCGSANECPAGHICVRFAPGDRPESACLPPCRTGADCPAGFLGLCSPEGICGL